VRAAIVALLSSGGSLEALDVTRKFTLKKRG
jgi:hypothetical protein